MTHTREENARDEQQASRNMKLDKDSWDMPSIIDRFETLIDFYDTDYEINRPLLAEELESMAIWLRST